MPPTAGSSTAEQQPRFYYDLASPESYLVAERALHAVGAVPEWIPVTSAGAAFRCAAEVDAYREDVERRAAALGLMPLRWPRAVARGRLRRGRCSPRPTRSGSAAASPSRWPRCARRSPPAATSSEPDNVLIAAAACEMHPTAVVKGVGAGEHPARAGEAQRARAADGVTELPVDLDRRARAGRRARDPGLMRANRAYELHRAPPGTLLPPLGRARAGRGRSRSTPARSSSSGTPARATPASSPAPCAPTSRAGGGRVLRQVAAYES